MWIYSTVIFSLQLFVIIYTPLLPRHVFCLHLLMSDVQGECRRGSSMVPGHKSGGDSIIPRWCCWWAQGAEDGRALSGRGQHRNRRARWPIPLTIFSAPLTCLLKLESMQSRFTSRPWRSKSQHCGILAKQFSEKPCEHRTRRTGQHGEKSLITTALAISPKYTYKKVNESSTTQSRISEE